MWSVLASVDVGVWDWDVAANRVEWSDDVEGLFGLARGAFGRTYEAYLALIHADNRALVVRYIEEIVAGTRNGYELEHRITWPDGSVHWLACKAHAYRDEAGTLFRVAGTVVDITRRKQAEAAVRDTDQLYRSAMDLSPLGMVVVDV
jgi:PAS domain S-box-containing protein